MVPACALNNLLEEASKRRFQKAFKQNLKKWIYLLGGIFTDAKMAEVLDALADGKWHTKREILEKAKLKPTQLETVIKFLEDYGFIAVDTAKGTVRLDEKLRKLLFQEASP